MRMGGKAPGIMKSCIGIFLCCVLLMQAGCAGKEPSEDGLTEDRQVSAAGDVTQGRELFFNEYIPLILKKPAEEFTEQEVWADIGGGRLYLLSCYETDSEEDRTEYFLNIFDPETRKLEQKPFSMELPEGEGFYIDSMEVIGEGELSFRIKKYSDMDAPGLLVRTDMEGKTLRQEDFPDKDDYPWNPEGMERRAVFDTADGPILREWDEAEGSKLFWFDPEKGGRRLLASLEGEFLVDLYLENENTMYYIGNNDLIRWDMEGNTRQGIMDVYELGISPLADFTGLLMDDKGEILLCTLEGDALGVYVLSEEEKTAKDEIRLAYIRNSVSDYTSKLAARLSRQHGECPIRIEKSTGDEDEYRERILMELAAGKGPEMMIVSRKDMKLLEEKGALMDMSELIPDDVMEQLWPCVVADTTINGKVMGVEPFFTVSTMLASPRVWEGNSWTLSEFLEVARNRTDWDMLLGDASRLDGWSLFVNLCRDLANTPFLDMERGEADFDQEEFRFLLELCRQYGGKALHSVEEAYDPSRLVGWDEARKILREGRCVAQAYEIYNGLQSFSSVMAEYGEDAYIVGCPSNAGEGNFIRNSEGYLVVNRKAEHLDMIREYIALLLDYDNQFTVYGCSVRKDVIENCLIDTNTPDGSLWVLQGKNGDTDIMGQIDLKPDGTSYLEEYMEFMDSCVPEPELPSEILEILLEEMDPYLAGGRDVEDTVRVIQNRVQLYLDERK